MMPRKAILNTLTEIKDELGRICPDRHNLAQLGTLSFLALRPPKGLISLDIVKNT